MQECRSGEIAKMQVIMEPDISELDGVVVIGYGTSKKSDLTGSVSSLRSRTLEEDPSSSFTGMLAGRIPGVLAVSTGGAPGSKTNIVIRGASSVSGGTSPLYVVDGVMMGGETDEVSAACRPYWNEDGTVKHKGIDHNWQDEILRVAVSHNFNLSVKGGGKNTNYAVSAGYLTKEGVAVGSSMDRFTFSSKINSDVKKWLKIGVDIKGSRMVNDGIISATNQLQSNVFAQMLTFNPTLDIDDRSMDLTDGNDPSRNPLANATETVQNNISNRVQGLGFAEFRIAKGLTFRTSLGGYFNAAKSKNYYPSDIGPGQGFLSLSDCRQGIIRGFSVDYSTLLLPRA